MKNFGQSPRGHFVTTKRFTISNSSDLEFKKPLDIYEVNILDCPFSAELKKELQLQFLFYYLDLIFVACCLAFLICA